MHYCFDHASFSGLVFPTFRVPTEDALIGLYGYKVPLAFFVYGRRGKVAIQFGVWYPSDSANINSQRLDDSKQVVRSVLNSLYPGIDLSDGDVSLRPSPLSGLVLGIPTTKFPTSSDPALPMDRLITALSGTSWAFLVLAYPFQESEMAKLRLGLISELREIQTQVARTNDPSPLAGYYSELLRKGLETVTTGHEIGMWRTAVYLLGDNSGKIRH